MAIQIQFKRGTLANLPVLAAGEFAYTTDSKQVYIGDGANNHLVGRFIILDTEAEGRTLYETNGNAVYTKDTGKTFLYLGSGTGEGWQLIGVADLEDIAGDLDDIADGTTYGKVKNTELNSGQVKQVRAVTGAANVTGDNIKDHIDDADKHREINDSGTAVTDLWSGNKIQSELDAIDSGIGSSIHTPVQDINALKAIDSVATGNEVSDKMLIHVENNGLFRFDLESSAAPDDVDVVRPTDRGALNGRWIRMTDPTNNHNNLSNLDGGGGGEYYHMTSAQHTSATREATASQNGLMSSAYANKLDGISAGAEVNQSITGDEGIVVTGTTGDDVEIDADWEANVANIIGVNETAASVGTSTKVAKSDHRHSILDLDLGSF
ncbi:MAG: hypothetical protein KAX49_13690 [Halanaerobiales bacterium]|nr:hypothetical protein [Halanaerobiales bacterium]